MPPAAPRQFLRGKERPIPPARAASPEAQPSLAAVLAALGDETRLHIVRKLAAAGEVACGGFDLDLPKSTMSHHFGVLIAAGIIARRREGAVRWNRLRREEVDRRFPGLLGSVLASP